LKSNDDLLDSTSSPIRFKRYYW